MICDLYSVQSDIKPQVSQSKNFYLVEEEGYICCVEEQLCVDILLVVHLQTLRPQKM